MKHLDVVVCHPTISIEPIYEPSAASATSGRDTINRVGSTASAIQVTLKVIHLRIYYDTNITSGRVIRDLQPEEEMEAVDALEELHAAGVLKRVSSKWFRIEQARTKDPSKRAALEARDDEMSCVQTDHRLLGFNHQDLGQLGFIASPIITDIVDEDVFDRVRAAGLAERDAFHVMCAVWAIVTSSSRSMRRTFCPGVLRLKPRVRKS
jgi:hypothetical protein